MWDVDARIGAAGLDAARAIAGEAANNNLRLVDSLADAVGDAEYIQESVLERYEAKAEIWRDIEEHCGERAVLGTSTSGLKISKLQEAVGDQLASRCIVAHPFNPPHVINLVELVPGDRTSQETLRQVERFFGAIGKAPVILKQEVAGHIANRLQAALWREAISLVHRGVASAEDVDKALHEGPGVRWALSGMHSIFDLGGGQGGYSKFYETVGKGCFEPIWGEMDSWDRAPEGVVAQIHDEIHQQQEVDRDAQVDYRNRGLNHIIEWKKSQKHQ